MSDRTVTLRILSRRMQCCFVTRAIRVTTWIATIHRSKKNQQVSILFWVLFNLKSTTQVVCNDQGSHLEKVGGNLFFSLSRKAIIICLYLIVAGKWVCSKCVLELGVDSTQQMELDIDREVSHDSISTSTTGLFSQYIQGDQRGRMQTKTNRV